MHISRAMMVSPDPGRAPGSFGHLTNTLEQAPHPPGLCAQELCAELVGWEPCQGPYSSPRKSMLSLASCHLEAPTAGRACTALMLGAAWHVGCLQDTSLQTLSSSYCWKPRSAAGVLPRHCPFTLGRKGWFSCRTECCLVSEGAGLGRGEDLPWWMVPSAAVALGPHGARAAHPPPTLPSWSDCGASPWGLRLLCSACLSSWPFPGLLQPGI